LEQIKTETQYSDQPKARSSHHPAIKAGGFISELLQDGLAVSSIKSWRFGIDSGDCAFYWSERTGYTATGRPMVRARILASLTARYRTRVLVTDPVREKLNQPVRKRHTLGGEGVYELLIQK
jgi:hypothetical protein